MVARIVAETLMRQAEVLVSKVKTSGKGGAAYQLLVIYGKDQNLLEFFEFAANAVFCKGQ
jgi:hypothetical protein